MSDAIKPAAAAARLKKLSGLRPALAMVLGSGFQHVAAGLRMGNRIAYGKLPGFALPGVGGHAGELLLGHLGETPVLLLSGRTHFYEGYTMGEVTFAVRTLAAFGIRDLLLTNAAGGIRANLRPGEFMSLSDHINFMGTNPLRGESRPGSARFVDLTETYDPVLRRLLRQAARRAKVRLHSGVYLAVCGPTFETPAEIHAFGRLGADAVGMSTVPEAIVARQCGIRVAAVSCITNLAAGRNRQALSHTHVLDVAERVKTRAEALLKTFAELYARQ